MEPGTRFVNRNAWIQHLGLRILDPGSGIKVWILGDTATTSVCVFPQMSCNKTQACEEMIVFLIYDTLGMHHGILHIYKLHDSVPTLETHTSYMFIVMGLYVNLGLLTHELAQSRWQEMYV